MIGPEDDHILGETSCPVILSDRIQLIILFMIIKYKFINFLFRYLYSVGKA